MGKIFVEGIEIDIHEKKTSEEDEHAIKEGMYVMKSVATNKFRSSIYEYATGEKVLISKVVRFSKEYYRIVLFNDLEKKAWNLLEASCEMDTKVRRLTSTMFFIWNQTQVSFCQILPSTRVQEFTTNFGKLNDIYFESDYILVSYADGRRNTIASFGLDGKLIRTHYEN